MFYNLKIIFLGSIIMAVQYTLLKKHHDSKNTAGIILYKSLVFLSSIFFLGLLVINIYHSFSLDNVTQFAFSYNNYYLWFLCVLLSIILSLAKGEWIYKKQNIDIKHFALVSRILLFYTGFILLLSLPRVIVLFIFSSK